VNELIKVENMVVRYGEHTVLNGVDVSLVRGEILVILGGSGSGKSTLLRHMVGLRAPEEGRVMLFGRDLYALEEEEREDTLKRIGMLFQSAALFNSLTLEENIALPLIEHRGVAPEVAAVIARMKLAMVGLENSARLLPAEISGGMKKRAGLARALALDPQILLVDEPSSGLDRLTATGIYQLLRRLKEKRDVTLVVVTHDAAGVHTFADRFAVLNQGKIVACGSYDEVENSENSLVRELAGGAQT
jgi:phospholipid/cholesterol/gamma-HCH transport system ATP-binding protein